MTKVIPLSMAVSQNVDEFIKIDSNKPLINIYRLFATDFRKAPKSATPDIRVDIRNYDFTAAAPTGKQFANAQVVCVDDNLQKLTIPAPQFNLRLPLVGDLDDFCDNVEDQKKQQERLTVYKLGKLYAGVENRVALMGFGIARNGKLEAHGATFDFGQSHIYAATASEKYDDANFDVMEFIGDRLNTVNADKVLIPFSDLKDFQASIKDCGGDNCNGKGFIKHNDQTNIKEKGYKLIGYHEDSGVPIYAISAKVTEKVIDETTGETKEVSVKLLGAGEMLFASKDVIRHKFGALQDASTGISLPKKTDFRMFKTINEEKGLVDARLQTAIAPYLIDNEALQIVKGLK